MIENYPDWNSLPGLILDGGYELKDIVEAERERAMIRVRVLGDYTLKASASFFLIDSTAAEKQAEVWQSLRAFERKTNLSTPLGAGTLMLNDSSTVYLVLQNPDERLAEILAQRALRPEEATEVLRCVGRALEELHSHGLVHGCVSPAEVFAFENSIKLSTQSAREVNGESIVDSTIAEYLAPESGTRNLTIASDCWCLGASLYEMLTQKKYEPGLYEEAIALNHPFGTVAERCLESDPDKRCKIAELEPILRSKAPLAKPKQTSTVPTVTAGQSVKAAAVGGILPNESPIRKPDAGRFGTQSPAVEVRSVTAELRATEQPGIDARAGRASSTNNTNETSSGPKPRSVFASSSVPNPAREGAQLIEERGNPFAGRRGLLYAVGAFVVIFLVLWMVRARSAAKAPATPGVQSKVAGNTSEASSQSKPAWPTKTLDPDVQQSKTGAPSTGNHEPQPSTQAGERTIWRVILYTYNRQPDAEKKAHELAAKRPDLQTEVFSPSSSGGPYLVIAGGKLNHDEAVSMRQRALREAMPRDSYIQNYNR
jgi:serine/threonine protein kinase